MFHSTLARMWSNLMSAVEIEDCHLALAVGTLVKHGTLLSGGDADSGMVWALNAVQEYLPVTTLDMLEGYGLDAGAAEEVRHAVRVAFGSL